MSNYFYMESLRGAMESLRGAGGYYPPNTRTK